MQEVLSGKFIATDKSFEVQISVLLVMLDSDAVRGFRQWQWRKFHYR